MNTQKRSLKKDEKAVSPVIGVIMMIAIVVIIAAVVAAFAYGIIGGVKKAPSSALVVEGVNTGTNVTVSIFHHGGDTITNAFDTDESGSILAKWEYLQVRLNGEVVTGATLQSAVKNNDLDFTAAWADDEASFAPGDQLSLVFTQLNTSDSIILLHTPSENILQRITVSG